MKRMMSFGAAVMSAMALQAMMDEEMAQMVSEDLAHVIRPVGVDGQTESWNVNATWFMYPPQLVFPSAAGAKGYRVRIIDANGQVHTEGQWTDPDDLDDAHRAVASD